MEGDTISRDTGENRKRRHGDRLWNWVWFIRPVLCVYLYDLCMTCSISIEPGLAEVRYRPGFDG